MVRHKEHPLQISFHICTSFNMPTWMNKYKVGENVCAPPFRTDWTRNATKIQRKKEWMKNKRVIPIKQKHSIQTIRNSWWHEFRLMCLPCGMVRYLFGFECLNMELIQQLWQEIYISRKSKMMSRLHQNVYMFMFTRIFVCLYRRNGTYKTGKKERKRFGWSICSHFVCYVGNCIAHNDSTSHKDEMIQWYNDTNVRMVYACPLLCRILFLVASMKMERVKNAGFIFLYITPTDHGTHTHNFKSIAAFVP